MENLNKLIEAASKLISAIAWPGIFLYIVVRYQNGIGAFFHSLSEGSLEAFGVKASAKRLNAVAAIATAQLAHEEGISASGASEQASAAQRISSSLNAADQIVTDGTLRSLKGKRVLWVDDEPMNNLLERRALESLGLQIDTASSTAAALTKIRTRKKYDLILSDMVRPEGTQAGHDLIKKLRENHIFTPFIIYSGSSTSEEQILSQSIGAFGRASDPSDLLTMVKSAIMN